MVLAPPLRRLPPTPFPIDRTRVGRCRPWIEASVRQRQHSRQVRPVAARRPATRGFRGIAGRPSLAAARLGWRGEGEDRLADARTQAPPDREHRCLLQQVGRAAVVSTAVVTGLTLAGFLGRWWWVLDLFANLRWQLALAAAAVTALAVVTRRRRAAAFALLAAAVNAFLVLPFLFPTAPADPAPESEVLELTFLNVKIRAADVTELAAHLRDRNDDVVILAATTGRWADAFAEADSGLTPVMGADFVSGLELTVLVRDPGAAVEVRQLTAEKRSAYVAVDVELEGQLVRILGTHPVSPLTPSRAARRDAHLEWLAGEIAGMTEPVVLFGDLNLTPWSAHFEPFLATAGLRDARREHGLQPSWPASMGPLGIPIDHALHSPELRIVDWQLGPSFGSDHRSVHVRVARR
jgi:endonuclease/exonuclease/phosphatase (EEP) superfamily protein YafD